MDGASTFIKRGGVRGEEFGSGSDAPTVLKKKQRGRVELVSACGWGVLVKFVASSMSWKEPWMGGDNVSEF